jgi:hypothetical protein
MIQIVTGLYDTYGEAEAAVRELEAAGVPHHDISLIASDATGEHAGKLGHAGNKAAQDAGVGAGAGVAIGGAGGVLAGIGLLAIPGLGPVVAAGWLASMAVGAVVGGAVGAAAGGLVGALTKEGVPERDAEVYAEGVRRGGVLVSAKVDNTHRHAAGVILGRAIDVRLRQDDYERAGWTGFDPYAPAYTPDQVIIERQR